MRPGSFVPVHSSLLHELDETTGSHRHCEDVHAAVAAVDNMVDAVIDRAAGLSGHGYK